MLSTSYHSAQVPVVWGFVCFFPFSIFFLRFLKSFLFFHVPAVKVLSPAFQVLLALFLLLHSFLTERVFCGLKLLYYPTSLKCGSIQISFFSSVSETIQLACLTQAMCFSVPYDLCSSQMGQCQVPTVHNSSYYLF